MNNIGKSDSSLYTTVTSASAPPEHRQLTEEEVRALSAPFKQSSIDLGDERLKQFLEKHEKSETTDLENDTEQMASRRSMRSFKTKRKRKRTMKRTRSLGNELLNIPNIVVTGCSLEDNSVTSVKL